jgi:hypothetical protein
MICCDLSFLSVIPQVSPNQNEVGRILPQLEMQITNNDAIVNSISVPNQVSRHK